MTPNATYSTLPAHVQETTFGFPLYDQWLKALNRLDARVINSDFSDTVTLEMQIRKSKAHELESAFIELTSGKGRIEKID